MLMTAFKAILTREIICLCSNKLPKKEPKIVSIAAVFLERARNATPKETAAHNRTNHQFRFIFKNVFATNSPFETCPIRECFLSLYPSLEKSQMNQWISGLYSGAPKNS